MNDNLEPNIDPPEHPLVKCDDCQGRGWTRQVGILRLFCNTCEGHGEHEPMSRAKAEEIDAESTGDIRREAERVKPLLEKAMRDGLLGRLGLEEIK